MNNKAIRRIADTYGLTEQSRQLFEEMAELTVAINKYHRNSAKPKNSPSDCIDEQYLALQIMEEIADVTIMLEQMKYLINLDNSTIEEFIKHKLDRQLKRIDAISFNKLTFGEKVVSLLKQKGFTQRALAEAIGVTEVSLSRYISGDRVPKGPVIAKMAKVLGTTVEQLL